MPTKWHAFKVYTLVGVEVRGTRKRPHHRRLSISSLKCPPAPLSLPPTLPKAAADLLSVSIH